MQPKDEPSPKIGAGHAEAMFRQGLKELRGALYSESNVAQPSEYGLYGTSTQREVFEAKQADTREVDEEQPSILADRLRESQSREDHERDSRELSKE